MLPLLRSMRLRTVPLSLSGVVCGGVLGYAKGTCSNFTLVFLFITAAALQVLSNLSNEMGDYRSGVDDKGRVGPAYGLANGLTEKKLWRAINGTVALCCISGYLLIISSFEPLHRSMAARIMVLLGAVAIWAATHYTLGKKPYGYRGLGDVAVFVFFGLVAVLGSYYITAHAFDAMLLLPAIGIGMLSVAVLNVNNIRDMASDSGIRQTVPIRIGLYNARIYQTMLVAVGFDLMLLGSGTPWMALMLPPVAWHIVLVWRRTGKALDPALPLLVASTFIMAIIYTVVRYGV